jgi:PKD repeat protein
LTAISDNSVRVNGVSVGTVTLTATNKTTADEFTKTISIKTLW